MRRFSVPTHGNEHGFSLVELMIALTILGIITAQLFVAISTQQRAYVSNDRSIDAQENARQVLDLIAFDVRQGGFMVPTTTAVASMDGGASGADRLCASDSNFLTVPNSGETSTVFDNRADPLSGANTTSGNIDRITVDQLDLDGDGNGDFVGPTLPGGPDGAGIIISSGSASYCGRITRVDSGTNEIQFVDHNDMPIVLSANAVAVPAIVYELDEDPDGDPTTPDKQLMRNGIVLSTQVDDLQAEFWVDNQGLAGQVEANEFPIHDLNVPPSGGMIMDTSTIRRMRVSVISRSTNTQDSADAGSGDTQNANKGFLRRPAAANRDEGVRDGFRRRRFTASVLPRNIATGS